MSAATPPLRGAGPPRGSSKVAKPHLLESGTAQPLARTQLIWLALLLAACIVPWLISPQGYAIRVLTLLLLFAAMPRPGTSLVAWPTKSR